MAVIDLSGETRVRSAQILGSKQELFRLGARIADARHAQEHKAPKRSRPARNLGAHPALAGKRVSRHAKSSRPAKSGASGPPRKHLSIVGPPPCGIKSLGGRRRGTWLFVALQARGKEAVDAAPFRRSKVELRGKGLENCWGLYPSSLPEQVIWLDRNHLDLQIAGRTRRPGPRLPRSRASR